MDAWSRTATRYRMDRNGRMVSHDDTSDMLVPVRCNHCGRAYDLCNTETHDPKTGHAYGRYADCTMYRTPCCRRIVDDRPGWGGSGGAFTRLDRGADGGDGDDG